LSSVNFNPDYDMAVVCQFEYFRRFLFTRVSH
jgi:hypothetical protein